MIAVDDTAMHERKGGLTPPDALRESFPPGPGFAKLVAAGVLLLGLVVTIRGWIFYRHEAAEVRRSAYESLASIADLEAAGIAHWMKERRSDAQVLSTGQIVTGFLRDPNNADSRRRAVERLGVFRDAYGYVAVVVADAQGAVALKVPPDAPLAAGVVSDQIPAALSAKGVVVSDLHGAGPREPVYLWLSCPVVVSPPGAASVGGAILLVADPRDFLYPNVRKWPGSSRSGAMSLVLPREGGVEYLGEPDLAGTGEVPAPAGGRPGRADRPRLGALAGERGAGVFEALDRRGVAVLAAVRTVPGTPWLVVAREDVEEVLAPLRQQAWQVGIIAGLLILCGLLAVGLLWRRQKLAFVRASELRFRTLIENAPVAISISRHGQTIYVNHKFLALYGYASEAEVAGRSIADHWAPGFRELVIERARRRSRGERAESEYEGPGQRRDGTQFPVQAAVARVELPDGPASCAFLTDITGRRGAEQTLRQTKEQLQYILDNTRDAIFQVDLAGNYLYANAAAERLTGYSIAELRGMNLSQLVPAEHYGAVRERLVRRLAVGGEHSAMEVEVIRRDGRRLWVEVASSDVRDEEGRVCAMQGLARDVTERRRAEAQMVRLNRVHAMLTGINELIAQKQEPAAVLQAACRSAVSVGGFRMAWVGLLEPGGRNLRPLASAGAGVLPESAARGGPAGLALESGEHAVCNDLGNDPGMGSWAATAAAQGHASAAAFPLRTSGGMVGVLALYSAEPGLFEPDQVRLLDDLAADLGSGLELHQEETKRRQAEEELRESQRRFSDTLTNLEMIAVMCDREGTVTFCNNHLLGLTGWSSGDVVGRRWRDVFQPAPGDDRAGDPADTGITLESLARQFGGEILTRTGGRRLVKWTKTALRDTDGRLAGLAAIGDDITDRTRMERELKQSEERFRELAETIQEVFWIMESATGRMLYLSPAYEKIWGRPCRSLYDDPATWIETVHPEDRERMRRAVARQREGGAYDEEYRILRLDGQVRWVRDVAFPVRDAAGRVERVAGVARDVTEQRQMADQLQEAQKMEAVGQLAGGVAHDFNNILAAITIQAQLLAMARDLPPPVREGLGEIRLAADCAAKLTRQLLLFSRKQVMQSRDLDLNEVVTKIAAMLQRLVSERIQLRLRLHPAPLMIHADAGMLDQILLNLAVNARDAMPQGGTLAIQTGVREVDAGMAAFEPAAKPGRHVLLGVTDTGTGIPPEVLPRIFEPFFTTKGTGKGTGLGLATVFGIVRQHGGFIRVGSEPGKGATFEVFLPASEGAADRSVAEPEPEPVGGAETILLVEDDDRLRSLTRALLELAGYTVVVAVDGVEALDLAKTGGSGAALLVTDLVMPRGVSGQELARRLRLERPGLKVLFMSGYSAAIAGRQIDLSPGQGFLQKPFSREQLLHAARRCLDA